MSDLLCNDATRHSPHVWAHPEDVGWFEWCPGVNESDLRGGDDDLANWPPEPEEMSREQSAIWTVTNIATDPDACECRHEGLGIMWHRDFCPLSEAWRVVIKALEIS